MEVRWRAGDTPELLACGTVEALASVVPHGERCIFQESDSEDATRDPDPVFPSMMSWGGFVYVPFSRGLELSRTVDPNPEPRDELLHILPPQLVVGFPKPWPKVDRDVRSFSPPLIEMAP